MGGAARGVIHDNRGERRARWGKTSSRKSAAPHRFHFPTQASQRWRTEEIEQSGKTCERGRNTDESTHEHGVVKKLYNPGTENPINRGTVGFTRWGAQDIPTEGRTEHITYYHMAARHSG